MAMMSRYTAVAVQTIIRHVREPGWRDAIVGVHVGPAGDTRQELSLLPGGESQVEGERCRWR